MIRIRNDDIIVHSTDWKGKEVYRVKQIHRWISELPEHFIHVPTIVVNDIKLFPDGIEFIIEETKEGRMLPEVHGLNHVDYCSLPYNQIVDELTECLEWFDKTLSITPTLFFTPWGGMNSKTIDAAASVGLKAVGVDTYWSLEATVARLGKGESTDKLQGQEIFLHWWARGIRLKRLAMAVKYGSWEAAKAAPESKEYF